MSDLMTRARNMVVAVAVVVIGVAALQTFGGLGGQGEGEDDDRDRMNLALEIEGYTPEPGGDSFRVDVEANFASGGLHGRSNSRVWDRFRNKDKPPWVHKFRAKRGDLLSASVNVVAGGPIHDIGCFFYQQGVPGRQDGAVPGYSDITDVHGPVSGKGPNVATCLSTVR
jgi:hypothetical protein